jgi:ribosome-binding factor A
MNQRLLRLAENIRHLLSSAIQRNAINFLELDSISVTITYVTVSPDIRHAKVYFTSNQSESLKILKSCSKLFKKHLSQNMCTKTVPSLVFHIDENYERQSKIHDLLCKIEYSTEEDSKEDAERIESK